MNDFEWLKPYLHKGAKSTLIMLSVVMSPVMLLLVGGPVVVGIEEGFSPALLLFIMPILLFGAIYVYLAKRPMKQLRLSEDEFKSAMEKVTRVHFQGWILPAQYRVSVLARDKPSLLFWVKRKEIAKVSEIFRGAEITTTDKPS